MNEPNPKMPTVERDDWKVIETRKWAIQMVVGMTVDMIKLLLENGQQVEGKLTSETLIPEATKLVNFVLSPSPQS